MKHWQNQRILPVILGRAFEPFRSICNGSVNNESTGDGSSEASYIEKSLEEVERDHIYATLKFTGGQKSRAATILVSSVPLSIGSSRNSKVSKADRLP